MRLRFKEEDDLTDGRSDHTRPRVMRLVPSDDGRPVRLLYLTED